MWWRRNWWVVLFCLFATMVYAHFWKGKREDLRGLGLRLREIEKEKWLALQMKEDFEERIASQNDPAWIEMVLMRELGVVPEGFLKVHFKNE